MQPKYMHFNSSCSYTALAMLLEEKGIDTEDTDIALEIGLPWMFDKEDGYYLAGPMLQGAKWFDLFLTPRGLCLDEEIVERDRLAGYLRSNGTCMLGIKFSGNNGKHAVVFTGYDGKYHFLNPTTEKKLQPVELAMTEAELLDSADELTMVGTLREHAAEKPDLSALFENSVKMMRENCAEITEFANDAHSEEEHNEARDRLFRAFLVDGISMLELVNEYDLAIGFRRIQQNYLCFMGGHKRLPLKASISTDDLKELVERYISLCEKTAAERKPA